MLAREPEGPGNEGGHGVSFRRAAPEDIPVLAGLARDAWPARPGMVSIEAEARGMEAYVGHSMHASNWAELAYTQEGVLGFLFGRIDGYLAAPAPKRAVLGEMSQAFRSFLRRGRVSTWHILMIWAIILTELKLMVKMPRSDASVEMLIVDSRHRGRGIGTALLSRFLKAAEDAGSALVTVYSDDRMSDWRFYEARGFRKVATFHDNITSLYSGSDARGVVLALDPRRRS